jgi:hypothetical protein
MKFFRTPYFVLLFLIRFLVYLYRRFRRRSLRHLSLGATTYLRDPGFLAPLKPPF